MAVVNNSLIKHKLLLGVDDRGKISCHKVNLCFIYFDPSDCIVSISRKLFISNVSIYDHMNINHIPYALYSQFTHHMVSRIPNHEFSHFHESFNQ
jgi:hypothetical protein